MTNIYFKINSIRLRIENNRFFSIYNKLKEKDLKPTKENYDTILKELGNNKTNSYTSYVYFFKKYFFYNNKLGK